jgi:hypothetical protein
MLEVNDGLAWRLILFLLASPRLYDDDKEAPIQLTPRSILRQFKKLFEDV